MKLIRIFEELPDKIKCKLSDHDFLGALKTTFKPNSTIPILWLSLFTDKIIFCSTHRDRGIYSTYSQTDIDSIKVDAGSPFSIAKIVLILQDPSLDDIEITLSNKTDFEELKSLLKSLEYQVM